MIVQNWGFFFQNPFKKTPILNMTINVQNWGFFQENPNFEHYSMSKLGFFSKSLQKNPQFRMSKLGVHVHYWGIKCENWGFFKIPSKKPPIFNIYNSQFEFLSKKLDPKLVVFPKSLRS